MGAPSVVLVDRPAPHVVRLLMNRPEKRNAIDYEMREVLFETITGLLGEPDHRALVFGGAGGVLSAGGDLPSMVGLSEAQARDRMRHVHRLCRLIAEAPIPVVTAVEGFGAGAAIGLALLGDHIVVGENSKMLFPFMRLGLTPDWGTLYSLPRRIGLAKAREILSKDDIILGREAFRIGLADEFAESGEIMQAAVAKAATLARLPRGAFACMKRRLMQPSASLAEELRREEDDQAMLLLSRDFVEGHAAFMQKRAADFTKTEPDGH